MSSIAIKPMCRMLLSCAVIVNNNPPSPTPISLVAPKTPSPRNLSVVRTVAFDTHVPTRCCQKHCEAGDTPQHTGTPLVAHNSLYLFVLNMSLLNFVCVGGLKIVWIWAGQKSYGFGWAKNRMDLGGPKIVLCFCGENSVWIRACQKSIGFGLASVCWCK